MRRSYILTILLAVTSLALTPTPTIEPIPTSIRVVAAKTADGGSVFVEDGRVYKVDASGARTETELSREVFTDVFEAGDLVKQLHPELFEGDQKALVDFMLPPKTFKDGVYDYGVVTTMSAIGKGIGAIDTYGEPAEVVTMKAPEGYPAEQIYIMMMAVKGSDQALPVMMGIQKNSQDILFVNESASFSLFKERNAPIKTHTYDSIDNLRTALIEQRVEFVIPFSSADVSDSTLRLAYSKWKEDEYVRKARQYYMEKYGLQVTQRKLLKEGWKRDKKPAGFWFDLMLNEFKADKGLRGGFVGFLSSTNQPFIYLPQ